ncbi:leucine-rich repeat domain-containing protein [Prevotella denticola]|uniref:leucine-rich repeat domain-containing protein n=1 Tax=Prevotella denticola TaxID=28129 RepID=UPI001C5E4EF3|nr:leucine-rich repeat domain-containing protein [Prevotella denticola]MBW4715016.1 leucine-rich repeat domain-containing protein [Prevotella denticola]MBW4752082.1 leucine-rich repeat domain-containing protein [Prevotella denticola]
MRRIYVLGIMLMTIIMAYAGPTKVMKGDTLVITVNADGDLALSNFTEAEKAATHVKLVTANGVRISQTDWTNFFGGSYTTPPFSKIKDLDLALADFANDEMLVTLGQNSKFLNGGKVLGELVLPESIKETKFSFNDNLSKWRSVVFPNATKDGNKGTTKIGASVFSGTEWLHKLTIGTSVGSIADMAFNNCKNLTMVDFLYGVKKIDTHAFWGCTGLTSIILPESLEEIGLGAFESCKNLTTVRLPNSLKTIKQEAFEGTGLKTVVIPASVEHIERQAFGGTDSPLQDVYVLGSKTKADLQAFQPTGYTYGYSYNGPGKGEIVELSQFTTQTGHYTVLHYPEEACEKYINKYLQVIGTDKYAASGYPEWENKWVVDKNGNRYPTQDNGRFTNPGGDYAGWNEFMLTAKLKDTHKDERLVESKWYSVCFPFNLTEEQIKNAFGDATEVCEFSGVKSDNDPHITGKKYITLQFKTEVKDMKAHHPYMIHPGLHHAEYSIIVGVTKDTDADNDKFAKRLKAESVSHETDGVKYTFIGNYTEGAKVPMYSYYYYSGNDPKWENAFYKAMRTDVKFTPQTAVVELSRDNGVSGAAKQAFYTRSIDTDPTGISTLPAADTSKSARPFAGRNNVYSVYGQIVRLGTTNLEGLPAGLYIVNGKKYIVK